MVTVDALQWASRQPFKLATRATHSKAWVVERHDEILRNALHTCQTLLAIEGRDIKLSHALAGCVFSTPYLALLSIGAGTPYIALYGRVPPPKLLPQLEHIAGTSHPDDATGIDGSRHVHRLRGIMISSMVEALAE